MPSLDIYLPVSVYIKLHKERNMSKTIQDALLHWWDLQDRRKKREREKKK